MQGGDAETDSIHEAESDPPRLLRFAEQALLFVRARKFAEMEKLFDKQNLEWFRSEDLWLTYGSPAAHTARMYERDASETCSKLPLKSTLLAS